MEPTITPTPTTTPVVSLGDNPLQTDTSNDSPSRIGKKRNSSSLLPQKEDLVIGSTKADTILSAGLREKRNSNDDSSPKTSEEKHHLSVKFY